MLGNARGKNLALTCHIQVFLLAVHTETLRKICLLNHGEMTYAT